MSEANGLPKGWARATLAAVGKLHCGQSPSVADVNHDGKGMPYVTGPDQWDGSVLTVNKWTTDPRRVVPDGCIFITVKGAGVGTLFPGVAGAIGRDVYAYQPTAGLCPKFIEHSLRFNISEVLRHAKGDIPGLSKGHILGHTTAFPPRNEQDRIVEKIEELFSDLDAGVAALERAKANLKRYRASVLKAAVEGKLTAAWRAKHPDVEPAAKMLERILAERRRTWEANQLAKFTAAGKSPPKDWRAKYTEPSLPDTSNLHELPKGWCWATTEQLGDVQLGRQRSPKNRSKNYPTRYIRAANLTEQGLDLSDVLDMDFSPAEKPVYQLAPGDVLLSEASGSPDQVGKPIVWKGELDECCFQNTVIRLRPSVIASEYLLTVFRHFYFNKVFSRIAAGVGINHLSAAKFARIAVPLAPLAEQKLIAAEAAERLSQIEAANAAIGHGLQRAARLRQSILKRAFEGELVPQDPRDEPASVLLERIKKVGPVGSDVSKHRHVQKRRKAGTANA